MHIPIIYYYPFRVSPLRPNISIIYQVLGTGFNGVQVTGIRPGREGGRGPVVQIHIPGVPSRVIPVADIMEEQGSSLQPIFDPVPDPNPSSTLNRIPSLLCTSFHSKPNYAFEGVLTLNASVRTVARGDDLTSSPHS